MKEKNSFETELEFKSLPKTPSKLFWLVFPYYTVLFLVLGIYFVKHIDYASLNTVPAIFTDSLVITANVDVKKGSIMPAIDLNIISNPTSELVSKGKVLYNTNCTSCHGEEGKGDGVAAVALTPKPRNLVQVDGWTNGRTFTDLYNTLQKGVPNTGMIAYEFIPVLDRIAIIQYVRTMAVFPNVDGEEIALLDQTYSFTKGEISPNQITLEMASTKIAGENETKNSDVNLFLEKVNLSNEKNIVDLFNKYVSDKEQAASIFNRDFAKLNNAELFINRLIVSPGSSGFKPNVVDLSKEQLVQLYNVLVKAAS